MVRLKVLAAFPQTAGQIYFNSSIRDTGRT